MVKLQISFYARMRRSIGTCSNEQMPRFLPILFALLSIAGAASAETFRIVSYNVRYPASGDGDNRWDLRRDLFVASVRLMDPDIMGTQELFALQGNYLVEKAPEYKWFGVSRRGNDQDEHMGVFYKHAKFNLIESGNFWLSETPEVAGSMSWDVTLPRMVTWALFESKATRERFYFFNTHFPHRGQDAEARRQCALVLAKRMSGLKPDARVILTGDFNSAAAGPVYEAASTGLTDAWLSAPQRFGPEQTFHGFTGKADGRRIDWILTRGFRALLTETVTHSMNGRYPSDHFPILTVLETAR